SPATSKTMPDRTILVIGMSPDPYTTAFCGVETGIMKPNEAPKTAASAGIMGSTPAAEAIGITIGTTIVALAVLLVVSEIRIAISAATAEIATRLENPSASAMRVPSTS